MKEVEKQVTQSENGNRHTTWRVCLFPCQWKHSVESGIVANRKDESNKQ